MPNIATVLKEEILRLARKELRKELETLKKASSQYRSEIAALKRRALSLEKEVARLEKQGGKPKPTPSSEAQEKIRFSPKGLATHRARLDLSAQEAGLLIGVSAQTIYNWEAGKSRPRQGQLAAIAALRGMGKRVARARLAPTAEESSAN